MKYGYVCAGVEGTQTNHITLLSQFNWEHLQTNIIAHHILQECIREILQQRLLETAKD